MTAVASVVDAAVARLCAAGFSRDDARRDAGVLARSILRWSLADWLAQSSTEAPADFAPTLDALIARRARHEPVAYLLGEKEFYGRPYRVTRHTLIPRPETEGLVDATLAWLRERAEGALRPPRIIDVGTGSGCIAITLALEGASLGAKISATDISPDALATARENAHRLGAATVHFHQGDLLADVALPVDAIVSNPPYVPSHGRQSMQPDVADYEPSTALFAGDDGLDVIRQLIPEARRGLAPGGVLIMEVGIGQADAITALLEAAGFAGVERHADLQGIARVIVAHVPGPPGGPGL